MNELISLSDLIPTKSTSNSIFCGTNIHISEVKDYGLIRVQMFNRGTESIDKILTKINIELPSTGQTMFSKQNMTLWSAPGEWIVAVPSGSELVEAERLTKSFADILHAVTIMSDSRVILKLKGPLIRQLLAKGSAVDFHPSVFTFGCCITTKFAQIPVMITQTSEDTDFFLFTDSSYACYLSEWLIDAAAEFEFTN